MPQDVGDPLILGLEVELDLLGLLEDRSSVLVGRLGTCIGRCSLDVLAHDDDGEQDELEEARREPDDDLEHRA